MEENDSRIYPKWWNDEKYDPPEETRKEFFAPTFNPPQWRKHWLQRYAPSGPGWRSIPRGMLHSEEFYALSGDAAKLMNFLCDQIWMENGSLKNDGAIFFDESQRIAAGISGDFEQLKNEIRAFFLEIDPDIFQLQKKRWIHCFKRKNS
jgi:hypothetical protein